MLPSCLFFHWSIRFGEERDFTTAVCGRAKVEWRSSRHRLVHVFRPLLVFCYFFWLFFFRLFLLRLPLVRFCPVVLRFFRRSFFCAHIYGCFKVTVLLVSFDCKWNFISTKKSTGIDHLAGARGCRPSCFFFGFTPQLGWCTISLIILVLSVASIGSSMLPWALPSFFQFYSVKRVLPALLSELYLLGFGRTYWLSWGGWNRLFILFLPTLNRFYWILLG